MADDEQTRLLTEIRDILRANYALSEKVVARSRSMRSLRFVSLLVSAMTIGLLTLAFLRLR